jgi:hypothetical protein
VARGNNGFTFRISGYDSDLTYSLSASAGSVAWVNQTIGSAAVSGLSAGQEAQITISVSCGSCSSPTPLAFTSAALNAARTPTFGTPTADSGGFVVPISNYDADWTYRVRAGNASIDGDVVTALGLGVLQSVALTIESSRSGFITSTATVTGMSNSTPTTTVVRTPTTPSTTTVVPPSQTTTPNVSTSTTVPDPQITVPNVSIPPVQSSISIPVNVVGTSPFLSVGKSTTLSAIAKKYRVTVLSGSRLTAVVSTSSKKICKVVRSSIKATKKGTCRITLTVTPKKGKKKTKTVAIAVSR